MSVGSQPMYSPLRMKRSASTTLRAAANVSETASSAVVSVNTPATVHVPFSNRLLVSGQKSASAAPLFGAQYSSRSGAV